jgi:hypothetical protein
LAVVDYLVAVWAVGGGEVVGTRVWDAHEVVADKDVEIAVAGVTKAVVLVSYGEDVASKGALLVVGEVFGGAGFAGLGEDLRV